MARIAFATCYNRQSVDPRRPMAIGEDWRQNVYRAHTEDGDFFASREWRELRNAALKRDNYICQRCDNRRHSELTVHHIMPRSEGGGHDLYNLITLCDRCHDIVEVDDTLRTAAMIKASLYEGTALPVGIVYGGLHRTTENRPDWHAWVYGSSKRPHATDKGNRGTQE